MTNGGIAAERIRQAAVEGEIVPWQDVLHDGPVPHGLDDDALREARARFIAGEQWGALEEVRAELAARDAALEGTVGPVVLWFEHDLYDQLQLLQVLDRLRERRGAGLEVEAVDAPTYLGLLGADVFRKLFDLRDDVPAEVFALASRAWAAFRSPDPTAIEDLLSGDTDALPHLDAALRRHLEEFPSVGSGLSRSERQSLAAIAGGARTVREAYHSAHHAREDAVFLGDVAFLSLLRRLAEAREPLVRRPDGGALRPEGPGLFDAELELTDAGEAALAGTLDHVATNGLDRWLGGVHLEGRAVGWRWDPEAGRLTDGAGRGAAG